MLMLLSMAYLECKANQNQNVEDVAYGFSHTDATWYDESKTLQCNINEWLVPNQDQISNPLIVKLVDAYNCATVSRSVYSDMELVWRFYEDREDEEGLSKIINGFSFLDCSHIQDSTMRAMSNDLKNIAIRATLDSTVDFFSHSEDYDLTAISRYHTNNFGELTEEEYFALIDCNNYVPDYDSLTQMRMSDDSLHQVALLELLRTEKDINRRCIYALEYAHSSSDGPYFMDAVPYLVDVMLAGEYSIYLNDIWRTWRAMMSTMMGRSRDSHIPNWKYNELRKICAKTTLEHIYNHPDDIIAINNFVVLAYTVNIYRFGSYMFGNESFSEQMIMFPEYFAQFFDKE